MAQVREPNSVACAYQALIYCLICLLPPLLPPCPLPFPLISPSPLSLPPYFSALSFIPPALRYHVILTLAVGDKVTAVQDDIFVTILFNPWDNGKCMWARLRGLRNEGSLLAICRLSYSKRV